MTFDNDTIAKMNAIRVQIQNDPELPTIDHGESVTLLLWWTYILDRSETLGEDPAEAARAQLESFIEEVAPQLRMVRPS